MLKRFNLCITGQISKKQQCFIPYDLQDITKNKQPYEKQDIPKGLVVIN